MPLFRRTRSAKHPEPPTAAWQVTLHEELYLNNITIPEAGSQWLCILPVGEFSNDGRGTQSVTNQLIADLAADFNRSATDLLFDFDHDSVWGHTRAAGWSKQVEARPGEGLFISYPEWTATTRAAIEAGEWKYLSVAYFIQRNANGEYMGAHLHSVAITNTPYFYRGEVDAIMNARQSRFHTGPDAANYTTTATMNEEVLEKLGLPADATQEDYDAAVLNALNSSTSSGGASSGGASDGGASDGGASSGDGTFGAIDARLHALEQAREAEAAAAAAADVALRDQQIDNAVTAKLITPATATQLKASGLDAKGAADLLATMPANGGAPERVAVSGGQWTDTGRSTPELSSYMARAFNHLTV